MTDFDGPDLIQPPGSCIQEGKKHQIPLSCHRRWIRNGKHGFYRFTGKSVYFFLYAFLPPDLPCLLVKILEFYIPASQELKEHPKGAEPYIAGIRAASAGFLHPYDPFFDPFPFKVFPGEDFRRHPGVFQKTDI
ncbi:MAG: hypothetical protein V8R61_00825 [Enterocloster sp.]